MSLPVSPGAASAPWVVLKFGGTSVSSRARWDTISQLVMKRKSEGFRVLVVVSAVSGITNQLVALTRTGENLVARREQAMVRANLSPQGDRI